MNTQRRSALKLLSGLCGAAAVPGLAFAQNTGYPSRTVNMVVPYGVGGSTDIIGRLLTNDVGARHGGKFIVENKAGAGGNIGTAFVASSKPDGTTLLYSTATPFCINPYVYRSLPYDPNNDFVPVARTVELPLVLVVNKELGVNTLAQFVDYLRKNEKTSSFSSYGEGTSSHIAGTIFCKKIGAPGVLHVPYKDMRAMGDLVAGRNTFHIDSWSVQSALVKGGKLVPLAVSSSERLPWVPDLPTISSFIKDDYQVVTWHGVFAPRQTPVEILDFLTTEFTQSMAKESIQRTVTEQGFMVYPPASREEFKAFVEKDKSRWREYVRIAGIQPA
jgi:tripartite-type tricarboxylate transporter receptor subunit TctC